MSGAKKIGLKIRQVGTSSKKKEKVEKKKKKIPAKKPVKKKVRKKSPAKKLVKKRSRKKSPKKNIDSKELVEQLIAHNERNKQDEARKRKIMWTGVGVSMVLVVIVWFYSLQQSFVNNKIESNADDLVINDWDEIADSIGQQIHEIKQGIEKIDSFAEEEVIASTTIEQAEAEVVASTSMEDFLEGEAATSSEEVKN
jgi:hypothetical protein